MRLLQWFRRLYRNGRPSGMVAETQIPSDEPSQTPTVLDIGSKKSEGATGELHGEKRKPSHRSLHPDATMSCHHDMNRFAGVLAKLDSKRIPRLATQVRSRERTKFRSSVVRTLRSLRLSCKVLSPPLSGSYNILFPIQFRDGVQWLLKIPTNGGAGWDEQSARALTSEVLTMKLIYNNSSIRVPRIYNFDATSANVIKWRKEGTPLHYGWYQHDNPPGSLDRFREQALNGIAKAMVQFNTFSFPSAGALHYNAEDRRLDIGICRKVDHYAECERLGQGTDDDLTTFEEQGPFVAPKQYFLAPLDKHDASKLPHELQGYHKLLRLLIGWFFEATGEDPPSFVLAHPDFNFQNILVADDGSLRGLVDWDGVAACCATDDDGDPIMTPKELDRCREVYARSIEDALQDEGSRLAVSHSKFIQGGLAQGGHQPATRLSSLARSLYISANEPLSLPYNVPMILGKIIDLTVDEDYENFAIKVDGDTDRGLDPIIEEVKEGLKAIQKDPDVQWSVIEDNNKSTGWRYSLLKIKDNLTAIVGHVPCKSASTFMVFAASLTEVVEPHDQGPHTAVVHVPSIEDQTSLQRQLCIDTTLTTWRWCTLPSTWLAFLFSCLLAVPASFLLLMDWLQSLEVFPTVVLFASLLFTTSAFWTSLVALTLGGLLFARIMNETFHGRRMGVIRTVGNRKAIQGYGGTCSCEVENECHLYPEGRGSLAADGKSHATAEVSVVGGEIMPDMGIESLALMPRTSENTTHIIETWTTSSIASSIPSNPTSMHPTSASIDEDSPSETSDLEARIRRIWAEDPTHDFGHFTPKNIINALYTDTLDAERMARLKRGFRTLLGSLDERYRGLEGFS
ncbi:MAG: hypothetical protein Q9166_001152 [cf. Caloplaca sp. 2 TL-2023]